MNKGFIKLHRRTFNHKFWTKSRVFSEFEAWLDLLQQARFEETDTTEYVGDRPITYGRGQLPASRTFLGKRWGWGEYRVKDFLINLKKDKSITTKIVAGINVVTICKYDLYNPVGDDADYRKPRILPHGNGHEISGLQTSGPASSPDSSPHPPHNIKKEKKEKKKECVRAKATAFAPPTLIQVEEYCREKEINVDCQRFIDFYQSKGWMVGRNKMKDWRAAVRMWRSSAGYPQINLARGAKANITNFRNGTDYEQF